MGVPTPLNARIGRKLSTDLKECLCRVKISHRLHCFHRFFTSHKKGRELLETTTISVTDLRPFSKARLIRFCYMHWIAKAVVKQFPGFFVGRNVRVHRKISLIFNKLFGTRAWLRSCFTSLFSSLTLYPLREIIGTCILFPKGFSP